VKPLDQLSYYDLLGLTRGASADDVRAGFHRFAHLHHPVRHVASSLEVRFEAQKWFRRGTEAYRVLMHPENRRAYDAGLDGSHPGRLRFDPATRVGTARPSRGPDGTIGTSNPRARPFLQKAIDALSREDWPGAKLNLQFVLQYDPDNEAVRAKLDEIATRGLR
jgi:curved DNA-binding protein CbpA